MACGIKCLVEQFYERFDISVYSSLLRMISWRLASTRYPRIKTGFRVVGGYDPTQL